MKIDTEEDEEAFFGAMKKLAGYLNKRKQDNPDISPVVFKFARRFGENSHPCEGKEALIQEPMSSR